MGADGVEGVADGVAEGDEFVAGSGLIWVRWWLGGIIRHGSGCCCGDVMAGVMVVAGEGGGGRGKLRAICGVGCGSAWIAMIDGGI